MTPDGATSLVLCELNCVSELCDAGPREPAALAIYMISSLADDTTTRHLVVWRRHRAAARRGLERAAGAAHGLQKLCDEHLLRALGAHQ